VRILPFWQIHDALRVDITSGAVTARIPCIFCGIVSGQVPARVVFEDSNHIGFFPLAHINPGHVVLIPKQHTDYLFDLAAPQFQSLWATAALLAPELRRVTFAKRVGVAVEGFSVPHVHIRLVPVYAGDELNPTRAKPIESTEADRLQQLLRHAFGA